MSLTIRCCTCIAHVCMLKHDSNYIDKTMRLPHRHRQSELSHDPLRNEG